MRFRTRPVGAILAGGAVAGSAARRRSSSSHGRPLISYPLEAVRQALGKVAILAKADTKLPYVSGVTVWIEPEPRRAIRSSGSPRRSRWPTAVRCWCAAPICRSSAPELIRRLAQADPGRAPAVVACARGAHAAAARLLPAAGARTAAQEPPQAVSRPAARDRSPRSIRSCSRSTTPTSCSTSTRPTTCSRPRRCSTAGRTVAAPTRRSDSRHRRGGALAEREVVGAHAGRQLDGERELLRGRERDQRVEPLAGDGDDAVLDVRAGVGGRESAGRRAARDPGAGTFPAEVSTR